MAKGEGSCPRACIHTHTQPHTHRWFSICILNCATHKHPWFFGISPFASTHNPPNKNSTAVLWSKHRQCNNNDQIWSGIHCNEYYLFCKFIDPFWFLKVKIVFSAIQSDICALCNIGEEDVTTPLSLADLSKHLLVKDRKCNKCQWRLIEVGMSLALLLSWVSPRRARVDLLNYYF